MNKKYIVFGIGGVVILVLAYFFVYAKPFWKGGFFSAQERVATTTVNPALKNVAVSQKITFAEGCKISAEPKTLVVNKLTTLENTSKAGAWVSITGKKIYLLPSSQKLVVLNASTTKPTITVYCGEKLDTSKEIFVTK